MYSSSVTFKFIVILSVLTILNMAFFGITWHKKSQYYACSVDNVIDGTAMYIRKNGALSLEETLPESCRKFEDKTDTEESFNTAVKKLVDFCRSTNKSSKTAAANISNPVIILFTTWPRDASKDHIHTLTLRNWANLKPKVEVVVFTNSTEDEKLAKSFGARTLPILRHAGGGAPVLKWMFLTVMKTHPSSKLFGYVNADILFTNKLTDTLEAVLRIKNTSKPIFLVGRRINVEHVLPNETDSFSSLEKISKERGKLFYPNAEDYFITNAAFPWKKIIDVVIGRLAYDNWIVGHVICNMRIDVIDLSETVLAVHQTTKNGGNYEGFKNKHAHYNNALFKKLRIIPIFETGFTICSQELTKYNLCGDIYVFKRQSFWEKCKCPTTVLF
ncbi:uncharacterized protein LOC123543517 [Mercenaria mercenaria]|uniref:uncharacterized protein LOC123543517 n=1 Tax=Mercenaria mercenaria TaxID=6596 RepID=UPI00234F8B0F|nr:uncharacterized protein LOC123543517 [Mercenaria mercenaria]